MTSDHLPHTDHQARTEPGAEPGHTLRVGTRGSMLATTQSRDAAAALVAGTDVLVDLVTVRTQGDVDQRPLTTIGGTGVFVTAVRKALLDERVDIVVHSCKDLPTAPAPGIALACIPPREDPRDALISRNGQGLAALPSGAVVGTGSPRRAAQILRARPDLQVTAIRGNIDTRIGRVLGVQADLDAVVLAASGLARAGREHEISEKLDPSVMLPAPAQGALALECRTADALQESWIGQLLRTGDDARTHLAVAAERALLRALEAGCAAPVAAYATWLPTSSNATEESLETPGSPDAHSSTDSVASADSPGSGEAAGTEQLQLTALAISPDGATVISDQLVSTLEPSITHREEAIGLGERLAAALIDAGAGKLLAAAQQ